MNPNTAWSLITILANILALLSIVIYDEFEYETFLKWSLICLEVPVF